MFIFVERQLSNTHLIFVKSSNDFMFSYANVQQLLWKICFILITTFTLRSWRPQSSLSTYKREDRPNEQIDQFVRIIGKVSTVFHDWSLSMWKERRFLCRHAEHVFIIEKHAILFNLGFLITFLGLLCSRFISANTGTLCVTYYVCRKYSLFIQQEVLDRKQ